MDKIISKLIDKSIEAFILAIEIYNKPTIKYRVEGFSFLICNAWELMLKAHMIKKFGPDSIYFKDNPDRTLSLLDCVKKVFTNNKDPLRLNLEKIIELRNTSTHFITEEYEMIYFPLFQSNVLNFSNKMLDFHDKDVTEYVPENFLVLNVSVNAINNSSLIAKYPKEIAEKLINKKKEINKMSSDIQNEKFALIIEHHFYLEKNKSKATASFKIDNSAETAIAIFKDYKDPNKTHPYNAKRAIKEINKRLKRAKIDMELNMYQFLLFVDYFALKSDKRYCYIFYTSENAGPTYKYSQQAIDLVVNEIKKDPENIISNLKEKIKR